MSVQFGKWNFEGQPPDQEYLAQVNATLNLSGADNSESYTNGGITILYRAFHTTKESHREIQPHISASGSVITWDGRLDNRSELIGQLKNGLHTSSTDLDIVAAAYDRWNSSCFAKLIGDWELSIWNPNARSLILAKDVIGSRHLYYLVERNQITWSTVLYPLVRFADRTFALNEEYIAGWFPYYPSFHLTPYIGIHSVPPGSFVFLGPGKHAATTYWDFDPSKRIRYSSDAEYEDHFRTVFAQAVKRRLRSDRPVLAELSGGMDSSCLVCMADSVIGQGLPDAPRLDTISCYDDREPNWGERPFISLVESKRGHTGYHINVGALKNADGPSVSNCVSDFKNDSLAVVPIPNAHPSEIVLEFGACARSNGNRVIFSGYGGEEATGGGVPSPRPELQDLLVNAQFLLLARQLRAWGAKMKKNRLPLLWEAIRGFLPPSAIYMPEDMRPGPWFNTAFIHRNHAALFRYPFRLELFGPLPSFQQHIEGLDLVRRVLSYYPPPEFLCEKRYPYLDRDLLEFTFAIPIEQMVRLGKRRSLMRRALRGIAPNELLNKARKAAIAGEPPQSTPSKWPRPDEIGESFVSASMSMVDSGRLLEGLRRARQDQGVHIENLKRTVLMESWLRHLVQQGVLTGGISTDKAVFRPALCYEQERPALTNKFS